MQRIKLLKSSKYGKRDEIVVIDNNEAFGLIDSGAAILTKDIISDDYHTSGVKDGKPRIIRTYKRK